jgi:hypothetical protein
MIREPIDTTRTECSQALEQTSACKRRFGRFAFGNQIHSNIISSYEFNRNITTQNDPGKRIDAGLEILTTYKQVAHGRSNTDRHRDIVGALRVTVQG